MHNLNCGLPLYSYLHKITENPPFCAPPLRGMGARQHGRKRVPQGRASVGGSSAELPRGVSVVVVMPLLLLLVEFTTSAASCLGSMDDEAPAAFRQ